MTNVYNIENNLVKFVFMKNIRAKLKDKLYKLFNKKFTRSSFIQSIPEGISILEIGPFYNPVCRGERVEYFDILSQNDLIVRAKNIGASVDSEKIPFIHHVSATGDLEIIPKQFDAIISCHAIEHQLDLIGHLNSVSKLINGGGNYYIIAPDKRYCFDHFMAESTIAEVIEWHYSKKKKHTLKSVIEHRVLTTHNHPMMHWNGNHGSLENTCEKISSAIQEFNDAGTNSVDVHGWYFTPQSFVNIITILNDLKYIDFSVKKIIPTQYGNFEFYVVLEKS